MTERVLVTGGAGFIGSNLIAFLLANTSYDIVNLDRLDEAGTLERLAESKRRYPKRLRSVFHDLRAAINPQHFPELREPFRYICHLAAGSHVDRSIKDPIGHIYDNVLGTGNLLEYVRHHQPDAKVNFYSTDEVFGSAGPGVIFDEHSRWFPTNPYAATKAGGEALCPAYAHQYGLRIVVTHSCNLFGPGQFREKFVPLVTDQIRRDETVQIHAVDGVISTRLYMHVEDAARGTLTVLEKGGVIGNDRSGVYNIVGGDEWSNLEVAQRIAGLLDKPLRYELVANPPNRPRPDLRYAISGDKLRALGWQPRISLDEGLRQVVLGEPIGGQAA